ncbi:MAG: DUF692 domain-containing protein [Hydrogenophaga sp.]|uniref:MNIO family bufferin maturase n=1 Tax=Hydrogenophaga sp. TaxID=1904254 RepID=UPI0026367CC9|nr:DUF692 domain-containing protein [Hydrogenophaga sp.]MDM7943403.1 DUF692 domain-containing protein [Hydrogenophaga sp.]
MNGPPVSPSFCAPPVTLPRPRPADRRPLPQRAGLGLKPEHFAHVHEHRPDVGFFEVHAENFLVAGGPMHHHLTRIRESHALSIHGVGMSIGGVDALDTVHLEAVAGLVQRYQPAVFSEHLAWSSHGGVFFNDLLPLPYNLPTLQRVCEHVDLVQNRLGRTLLLENPSTYVEFISSTWSEGDFLREVIHRTGCGLLLDVNNVHVSSTNHGRDPERSLRELPCHAAGEIHLAGFAQDVDAAGDRLLIDTHGAPVAAAVWALYETALAITGPLPTLIERDNDLPAFEVLQQEARLAEQHLSAIACSASQAGPDLRAKTRCATEQVACP